MKGSLKRVIAIFMLFLHIVSLADGIVPDNGVSKNLQVDKAANGVPLINIEAPDNNGTSHNVYKDYNVDGRGAILNNSKDMTNTQLGGIILDNPNLQGGREASTIINEVSGVNKSRIEGYQEIAGKKANYILANPNGIYINGAGFINTGNVTLTTGSGNNLLNPEKGTIEVAGKGLDLRNINKAELVARVAELSAPIYGGEEVNLKLGSQGKANKPEYALDARALGSIYAGRINIIVNEDGVGVKTQAPMYAEKGDVVISSKGKVYLKDTQAKGNINISSTETEIGKKLLAENTIDIKSGKTTNSGQIQANNNITISGNVDSSNLISTNKDISISGNLTNTGEVSTKSLTINNLDNKGNITVINNVNSELITNNGKLLVGDTINSQNLTNTSTVQGKTLDIKNKVNSSGKMLADNISTKDISNSGNISSKTITTQELTNSGEIISNNLSSNNINNSKNIFVNGNLKILNNLNNSGIIEGLELNTSTIENTGNITIQNKLTSQNLNNKKNTANVNAGFLDVQNKISSVGNIKAITMKTSNLDNSGSVLTNSLTTTENINKGSITAKNISSQNLVNSGSVISDNITVSKNITNTNSIFANEKISADKISNSNKLVAKNTEVTTITNDGNIIVKENLKTKDITNSNSIEVGGNLNVDNLKNSKTLMSQNITIGNFLDNINGKITSLNTNINTSDIKNNNGTIQAIKNINITTTNDLNLDGNYTANDTLNIKAKSLENNVDLKNDGKITFNLSGDLTNNKNISSTGNLNINAQKVLNTKNDSAIGSMANLSITASSLENKGNILFGEGKDNKLKTTGNINNTGVISSLGKLKIEAKEVLNDKHIISDNDLALDVNSITNKGLLYSTNNMKVDFKDIFLNDKAYIYSSGDITITGKEGTFTNKVGDIESEKNIKIEAKDIKNLAEVTGNHKVVGTVPGNQSNIDMSKVDIDKYNKLSIEIIKEYFRKYSVPSDTEIKKVEDYVRFDKRKGEEFTTSDGKKGQWTWQEGKYIDGVYLNKADKIESNYQSKKSTIKAAGDITLIAKNDVENLESNILANKDITIQANRLINKNYDIEVERNVEFIRGYEFHESARNPYDIRNKLVMDGKVLVGSPWDKGDVFVKGQIKADGNITQAGVKDINYSYYKKTKTGFMGLTSKSVTDENYAEKAILSATLAGDKGLTYDSKNNLILSGVKVVSSGSINLKGKNVEINPLATKSYNKHEEVKKGFSSSFSPKGISVSYGKDKLDSKTDIVNQTVSQIISNKDINIEATDKVKAKSVDIYAKNDINISGDNGVEISTANNSYDNTTKQSSSRIGASVGINSAIVNTVENVRDIKELTDFSGNNYDILNNASKTVGAIKDGAKATNDLINFEYSVDDVTGAETLKYKPRIFSASASYNKSESKSSIHNETIEKNSLVARNNMNIKSKNGSITISGTDIKVGNDLDLNAKKDITIKASEENFTSSNSSSQMGIGLSADLSKGKTANLSISKAGTTGRGNGTNYINSTIDVGGKLKTNSENLTLSGANVEADKVDIKAKNIVIESKQDKSEREDSSYGGSFSIDLANPSSFSANINGSKGNGEKEWVNKQTTLIARNGGKIDTDSLTNIGAVIGSESEKEKLKVSANKVVVKDLEDKNKYENIGGGITIGTDVPNISIKHDKVDKEQINRATAKNTDFEISGKKTSAEDLGFNTDINKAQEKTKDEEKHLDAELHTDLIGEDKRNEIKYAYKKLGSLKEILDQKKFKESMEGVLLDKFKDEHQKEFNLIKDENLSLEDKQKLAQNLVERYLRENGYQGVIPEVLLTDEAHSFSVDSKDKETGTKRREKIYFSINDIADPNLAFSRLFGHEKAHMNTYDEGKYGEETSIHTTKKIGSENKNKVFTEEEKADYLNNLRNKYKDQKSIEQQFAEAKLVPEKDKEHWAVVISANTAIAMGLRVNEGSSLAFIEDPKTGDMYFAQTTDVGIGLGTPAIGGGISGAYFSDVNKPEDLNGWIGTLGGSYSTLGGDLHTNFGKDKKFIAGIRLNVSKGMEMHKIFNIKYFKGEGHISGDYSHVVWSKKINDDNDGKYIKEQLEKVNPNYKNEVNLETVEFISNYLIENRERLHHKTEFDKAYDRLKKLRVEGYYD
ncbi:hemagglutinin repeat-containing protein [Fusobacterium polymorphum]|uniref:hemagglutinin repeat-containing protein n=1 Tax=Fusobacterium nucleatum subsp. polymorphum TaxID=76857 RepID=UPI00072031EE|nr:hemagglutinin repeat-containing protein [Fusobacterium polymorphum]ALQ42272.1 hypothetical protein RN93_05555 [Fusobacterium polymorphum]